MTNFIEPITNINWQSTNGILIAAAAAATGVYVANLLLTPEDKEAAKFKRLASLPSPPGALPVVGHLLSVGPAPHITFAKWGKTLGPIFAVKMGSSRTWVVHNSPEVIRELMDRRGATYSDRIHTDIIDAISLNGIMYGLASYGPYLRYWRKLTNNTLNKTKLEQNYSDVFTNESRHLLLSILENEKYSTTGYDPMEDIYRYNINAVNTIIFKKRFGPDDPNFMDIFILARDFFNITSMFLTELFPFLKPFLRGQIKLGEEMQKRVQTVFGRFVEEIRQARKDGKEIQCACNEYLKAQETDNEEGHATDLARVDTTSNTVLCIFTVLLNHPEIQDRAYAEIKEKIGIDRLPTSEDEELVPYTRAIFVEALRFRPPLWLGVPHSNPNDEEYDGYHIPAGSAHIINIYGLHFNPEIYPDPYSFKPERHIDTGNVRQHFSFGAGRRICPGSFLAEKSLFLVIARLLWAFRVEHALDDKGNRIEVPVIDEKINPPLPPRFKMRFVPRHDNIRKLTSFD